MVIFFRIIIVCLLFFKIVISGFFGLIVSYFLLLKKLSEILN